MCVLFFHAAKAHSGKWNIAMSLRERSSFIQFKVAIVFIYGFSISFVSITIALLFEKQFQNIIDFDLLRLILCFYSFQTRLGVHANRMQKPTI